MSWIDIRCGFGLRRGGCPKASRGGTSWRASSACSQPVVRRGILTPYWGLSASKIDPPGFVLLNTPCCLDRRGGGDAGCGDDCADPSGSSGEGCSDQEDRPGFEGFEEHGAQGGSGVMRPRSATRARSSRCRSLGRGWRSWSAGLRPTRRSRAGIVCLCCGFMKTLRLWVMAAATTRCAATPGPGVGGGGCCRRRRVLCR